jgi:hypothetical protein
MSEYTSGLTAVQLITYIANDYVELSHDKIAWQRDDHMKICREWLSSDKEYWVDLLWEVVHGERSCRNAADRIVKAIERAREDGTSAPDQAEE